MKFRLLILAIAILAIAVIVDGASTWWLIEGIGGGFYETNDWAAGMFNDFGYEIGIFMVFAGKMLIISAVGLLAALILHRGIAVATLIAFGFAALHFYAGYKNWLLIP